jgi:anthranilate phosphoribosyltransferase
MPIQNKIAKLLAGETFEAQEAASLMMAILDEDDIDELQIAAILALIESRGVSSAELMGFRSILRSRGIRVNLGEVVDVCGTGGDKKNTFNISTLSAFILAGLDIKVAKHGNYSASGSCGSSNLLEKAGLKFAVEEPTLIKSLNRASICYLHAPNFQPSLAKLANIRKRLGFRTFFNLLGPLLNPANPNAQLVGVSDSRVFKIYSNYFQETNTKWLLVHSFDGYDEISLTGQFLIRGPKIDEVFYPEDLGFVRCRPQELNGGNTVEEALKIFLDILEGRGSVTQREVVVANAAFGIYVAKGSESIESCIKSARFSLEEGLALKAFNAMLKE